MSARPTYGTAIMRLIANERLAWLDDSKLAVTHTVRAISDLFEVPTDQIARDLQATLETAQPRLGITRPTFSRAIRIY